MYIYNIYVYNIYIYIYINLNPTIKIVKASKHLLNATEWTNCFRRRYLFHIVLKSLTRVLYRSMPSGDICSDEKKFRRHPPVFFV